jgi:hypothetical protein
MATLTHSRNPDYTGKSVLRSNGSGFTNEVSVFLHGIEGVQWAIDPNNVVVWKKPAHPHPFEYCVHSDWIIAIIDEIMAGNNKGFAYNVDVHILARERLGLPKLSDAEAAKEGTPLSLLIYNAQGFRRDRDLRAAGFVPLTQEMIDGATAKQQIEVVDGTRCNVRMVSGIKYAFKPRKRNSALALNQPAKVVARQRRKQLTPA